MSAPSPNHDDLLLFDDQMPFDGDTPFVSACPPDKKVKVENLFQFKRGRGDLYISIVAAAIALFFLAF
ncbi:MAG: tripartite tricarboxylate transporter TctB family protein, partial [Rhodobacteraceae bacterium]|nr:tripartite tricarboxylate transporter TctB family protein [Paracoccaceae bacterium]